MKIAINTNLLIEHGLSADDIVAMTFLQRRAYNDLAVTPIVPDYLNMELSGFLTGDPEDVLTLKLTEKGNMLLGLDEASSSKLVKVYRKLFEGTAPGMMGDQYTVSARMKWFNSTYDFPDDTILIATQMYINDRRKERFQYMMNAGNFIMKHDDAGNPVSNLAGWCESAKEGMEQEDNFMDV